MTILVVEVTMRILFTYIIVLLIILSSCINNQKKTPEFTCDQWENFEIDSLEEFQNGELKTLYLNGAESNEKFSINFDGNSEPLSIGREYETDFFKELFYKNGVSEYYESSDSVKSVNSSICSWGRGVDSYLFLQELLRLNKSIYSFWNNSTEKVGLRDSIIVEYASIDSSYVNVSVANLSRIENYFLVIFDEGNINDTPLREESNGKEVWEFLNFSEMVLNKEYHRCPYYLLAYFDPCDEVPRERILIGIIENNLP